MENKPVQTETEQPKNYFRRDVYQEVTDIIVGQLEKGTVPWQQPWKSDHNGGYMGMPKNIASRKNYQGINIVLLWASAMNSDYNSSEWGTFKQWSEKRESIRKGEKGSMVVYYDTFEKEVDGEVQKIPFLKASVVFNRCQLASFKDEFAEIDSDKHPYEEEKIDAIEEFVMNTKATIQPVDFVAAYSTDKDRIFMPPIEKFFDTETASAHESYYSTLLHELTHWTGHPNRLNRTKGKRFGSKEYAFEELVAELGSAFMCSGFQFNTVIKGDHASYIAYWLEVLKDNKHFIVTAASEASKAVGYLQGLQPS